jgi:hypothetical protein
MDKRQQRREQILKEMAGIECMEKGRLTPEYRESVREGQKVLLGPYYKHQCWEGGHNKSRRVPVEDAEALGQAVEGYQRFTALAQEYADLTIAMTREQTSGTRSKKKPSLRSRRSSRRPKLS